MSFDDFLKEAEVNSQYHYLHRGCGMGKLIDTLDEYDAVQVRTALARQELTNAAIEKALKSRVDPSSVPSSYTIGRHRRGTCKCEGNNS